MRHAIAFALIAAFGLAGAPARGEDAPASVRPRVLILPFSNGGGASQDYLSLGLAEILTDRLEDAATFDVVTGEIPTLPDDVIDLAKEPKRPSEEAFAVAKAYGADLVVRGAFSGPVWDWRLEVEVLEVGPDAFRPLGSASVTGDQTVGLPGKRGKSRRIVSLVRIQDMLSDATRSAFAKSGRPLPAKDAALVARPVCRDAFAFILHERAVARTRTLPWVGKDKTALERSEHAVRVEPTCLPARRLYASLLERAGKHAKARGQFEALLSDAPDDLRSVVALGRIELGLGEIDSAKSRLSHAVVFRPDDASLRAAYAEALRRSGDMPGAIVEYEKALALSPDDSGLGRTLAELYGLEGRHAMAASTLSPIVSREPDDKASAFRVGAELRNASHADEALAWYRTMSVDAKDGRFARFASPPSDGTPVWETVAEADRLMREAEAIRKDAQTAMNDVVMEFGLRGKDACASSAYLLAKTRVDAHDAAVTRFSESVAILAKRRSEGEWAALGYREEAIAKSAVDADPVFRKDRAAFRLQWDRSVAPQMKRFGCAETDDVTMAAVRDRNASRLVEPAAYRSRPSSNPIAPQIPDGAIRIVRFRVVNADGMHRLTLTVDGTAAGEVPPGGTRTFAEKAGHHVLCLTGEGVECGAPGTLRHVFLHEGWTVSVRSAP